MEVILHVMTYVVTTCFESIQDHVVEDLSVVFNRLESDNSSDHIDREIKSETHVGGSFRWH